MKAQSIVRTAVATHRVVEDLRTIIERLQAFASTTDEPEKIFLMLTKEPGNAEVVIKLSEIVEIERVGRPTSRARDPGPPSRAHAGS